MGAVAMAGIAVTVMTAAGAPHYQGQHKMKTAANNFWFMTVSGRKFFPLDPNPDDIIIEDIAHALSHICRFGGHTRVFSSVAAHSVHVCNLLPDKYKFCGLMHDATEAYLGDVIRPLKLQLPDYKAAENKLWRITANKFGLPTEIPEIVHRADDISLVTEIRDLMPADKSAWEECFPDVVPDSIRILPAAPAIAKSMFLNKFAFLS